MPNFTHSNVTNILQEGGEFHPKDENGKVLFSDVDFIDTWKVSASTWYIICIMWTVIVYLAVCYSAAILNILKNTSTLYILSILIHK